MAQVSLLNSFGLEGQAHFPEEAWIVFISTSYCDCRLTNNSLPSDLKRTDHESSTFTSIKEDDWNFISIAHKQKQSQEILPLGASLCCTV